MNDLIDRNRLLNSLEKFAPEKHDALVEMLIKKEPTVDAIPVRHGKWIELDDGLHSCKCSCCGYEYTLYEDDINGFRYCANCGAKMDAERKEEKNEKRD